MLMSSKALLVAVAMACLAVHQTCEARSLDAQQESLLQAISQSLPTPQELQQQQHLQQALSRASLELDDDDDEDDRADQQAPQQLAQAASALYQQHKEQPVAVADQSNMGDLKPAASKHHHHGHGAKGWLDMGAWTGKKGAFGWYDKHPVGKGK